MAVASAPDWVTNAMFPGKALPGAKLAFKPMPGTRMPRQFGPAIRIRWGRAASSITLSRVWAPFCAACRRPADMCLSSPPTEAPSRMPSPSSYVEPRVNSFEPRAGVCAATMMCQEGPQHI